MINKFTLLDQDDKTQLQNDINKRIPLVNGQAVADGISMFSYKERYLGSVFNDDMANAKFDIILPAGNIMGWIEIDISSSWWKINLAGRLTKRISVISSDGGVAGCIDSKYVNADPAISGGLAISDIKTNGTNRYITVSFLTAWQATAFVTYRTQDINDIDISKITLSPLYYNDTTVYPKPTVWNNIQTGTWTPRLYGSTVEGMPTYANPISEQHTGSWTLLNNNNYHLTFDIHFDNIGTVEGALLIGDIPFTPNKIMAVERAGIFMSAQGSTSSNIPINSVLTATMRQTYMYISLGFHWILNNQMSPLTHLYFPASGIISGSVYW